MFNENGVRLVDSLALSDLVIKAVKNAHPVFVANDWKYFNGVPSKVQLSDALLDLITIATKEAARNDNHYAIVSSGRFTVQVTHHYPEDLEEPYEDIEISLDLGWEIA